MSTSNFLVDIRRVTRLEEPEAKKDCPFLEDLKSTMHHLQGKYPFIFGWSLLLGIRCSPLTRAYIQLMPLRAPYFITALVLTETHDELMGLEDDSSMVSLALQSIPYQCGHWENVKRYLTKCILWSTSGLSILDIYVVQIFSKTRRVPVHQYPRCNYPHYGKRDLDVY
ncbi:hypothetical protein EDD85DRAFT_595251 [Armillaria nabsnona]|nr:hypothetical protein EDD85DRAFT_595251 [Armillaria nabsnona]